MTAAASLDNTRLPRQIRERMERINAMTAEPQNDGSATPPIAAEAPQPGADPTATPQATAPLADQPNPNEASTAPQGDLRPFHDPALATDPRAQDPTYWRQRLSVMQGKLHEERRAAEARESALRSKITELEDQIRSLKAGSPAPVDVKSILTPEQLEALGEEHATAVVTAAVKAARTHVDTALEEQRAIAETRRAQETEQAQARRKREFLDQLEEVVPDWQTIDARTDWRKWLGEADPTTGRERQVALNMGIEAADVAGVAAIFRAFLRTLEVRPTPPTTAPSDAGRPAPAQASQVRDQSLIPPTDAEVREFYKRLSIKGGRGVTEAERVAFEKRLALL